MNRFLSVASSALIATGVAVLPVASFAQSGADAGKAPATTPVVSQDKTQPVKTTPANTDVTAPVKGKTETHSMNTQAKHHVAKAPAPAAKG
jgi:hypothetical protein